MRVAALYDIHGNLPALEAVLRDVRATGVDEIVVGGDVVPGPMPRETLHCLLGLDIPAQFIQGNGEAAVLAEYAGADSGVPAPFRDVVRWNARQLQPDDVRVMQGWANTLSVDDGTGRRVLFCHATPRNNTEIFIRTTPVEALLPVFAGVDAPLVICGHTHMQFDRMVGTTRVVNAGSVGMPFGHPSACWLLLDREPHHRKTAYDLASAAVRIRATSYPQATEFASRNVLQPPSEDEMNRVFAAAELK